MTAIRGPRMSAPRAPSIWGSRREYCEVNKELSAAAFFEGLCKEDTNLVCSYCGREKEQQVCPGCGASQYKKKR